MTPELPERNPFVSIAALVASLALVAGLAMRFGLNTFVAGICVVIAIVGTWVLLSPQIEVLESAVPRDEKPRLTTQGAGPGAVAGVSAFAGGTDTAPREGLRGAPRVAVGFDTEDAVRSAGGGSGQRSSLSGDVNSGDLNHGASKSGNSNHGGNDSAAPVQALGQLPRDASALQVASTVEPASNISGAYTLGDHEIRAASRRGSDHVILNDLRQDDYVVASAADGRYLVIVIAAGEGSAENAHYGSYWSCRLLARAIDQHLRDGVPGIENMLARTREELSRLFDLRFTDGTKMRTIATTLVGVIAPVAGGPAAGFRLGSGDIMMNGDDGWTSVFDAPVPEDTVFPRSIDADVAALNFDANCLLLAADGVAQPLVANSELADALAEGLEHPVSEVEFDQLMSFPLEEARGDRTAVAVWLDPK